MKSGFLRGMGLAVLLLAAPEAWAGSFQAWTFHSHLLGRDVRTEVFVPEGMDQRTRPWPVLYLMHGLDGNERDWVDAGKLGSIIEPLIAEGAIPPMLVVMPDGGDSWYIDDPRPGGFGPVFQAFSTELVKAIDRDFPTATCRELRLVGGLSMGGYGALMMAMEFPERFGAVLALSSAIFPPTSEDSTNRSKRHVPLFGDPFDWQRLNDWNLFKRIPMLAAKVQRPAIWLDAGDDDFPSLLATDVVFYQALRRAGIEAELRVVDGAHNWEHWRPSLGVALRWAAQRLPNRCPSGS